MANCKSVSLESALCSYNALQGTSQRKIVQFTRRFQAQKQSVRHLSSIQAQCTSRRAKLPQSHTSIPIYSQYSSHFSRSFTVSTHLYKKKGNKHDSKLAEAPESTEKGDAATDPYDFTVLNADIDKVRKRLTEDLSKLKPGGKFDTSLIEQIRVPIGKKEPAQATAPSKSRQNAKGKASKDAEVVPVSELAQVVPKGGRTVLLIVGEEDVSLAAP
jgi:hypothetical protein